MPATHFLHECEQAVFGLGDPQRIASTDTRHTSAAFVEAEMLALIFLDCVRRVLQLELARKNDGAALDSLRSNVERRSWRIRRLALPKLQHFASPLPSLGNVVPRFTRHF